MENKKTIEQQINESLIRIKDPDIPIYRIFPLWFFEEVLRLKRLTLVQPKSWEDPYEIIGDAIAVDFDTENGRKQKIINQELPPVFSQCWSATEESDTLLRAYSRVVKDKYSQRNTCPKEEGVRVKTTPRKLLSALLSNTPKRPEGYWFLGAVEYLKQDNVLNNIGITIKTNGLDAYRAPENRARLLLMKREAFSHENELRVLFVQRDTDSIREILQIPIDPNEVFEEISFDPRVDEFERKERKEVIKKLGFKGIINDNDLYQRTYLQIYVGELSTLE